MLNQNFLGIVDYIVVAFCLLFSLFIGVFFATRGRKTSNNDELLVGNRNMGPIPVAGMFFVCTVNK
jgi:Na+/proline symporter